MSERAMSDCAVCPNRKDDDGLRCALMQVLGHACPPSWSGAPPAYAVVEDAWVEAMQGWLKTGGPVPMPPSWLFGPAFTLHPTAVAGEVANAALPFKPGRKEKPAKADLSAPAAAPALKERPVPVSEPEAEIEGTPAVPAPPAAASAPAAPLA